MSYKNRFTSEEWEKLQLAPIWMFLIVAGIDQKVDKKEMKEFVKQVVLAPGHSREFGQEVFQAFQQEFGRLLHKANQQIPVEGLRDVAALLERVEADQKDDFIATLVLLGHQVADSSGSIFKKNVSNEEAAGIVIAKAILEGKVLAK
jgi:hypothetical protein